jgi:hypothetical protein
MVSVWFTLLTGNSAKGRRLRAVSHFSRAEKNPASFSQVSRQQRAFSSGSPCQTSHSYITHWIVGGFSRWV